jgi:hypothetical protein
MDRAGRERYLCRVAACDTRLLARAAQAILDQGGWCVLEECVDVPSQRWEARLLIFDRVAEGVAEVVGLEVAADPHHDLRLTGCDRGTLRPEPDMGAHLCYLAGVPEVVIPLPRRAARTRRTR